MSKKKAKIVAKVIGKLVFILFKSESVMTKNLYLELRTCALKGMFIQIPWCE